jgi:hypothetical protein
MPPARPTERLLSAVAHVHNYVDNARPHGIGDGHAMEHRKCIVPDSAPGAFGFAEHVMGTGGRKLHIDAQASAHLAIDCSLKNIVKVKLQDRCERA